MFDELISSFKALPTDLKRQKLLDEVKYLIAAYERICLENDIEYNKIKSKEILDLNNGTESEDDYLEALFVYMQYLKEVSSSAFLWKKGE